MDIELIINSSDLGALAQLRTEVSRLRDEGHRVRPRITFEKGDAARFAEQAAADEMELVIAAGGDGTINEVVNGLQHRAVDGPRCESLPRLGIIPLGTANDFAASFGIPNTIPEAIRVAVAGTRIEVDVALVNDRYFVNVSTGGIGAEATEEAPDNVKRTLGTLAYVITGLRKFASLQTSVARFESAGEVLYDGPFLLFAVGNAQRTGGGNWITPNADLADGLLDVCIVKEVSHADFLRLMPDLRAGRHVGHPQVVYRQVRQVTVGPEKALSVNVDGEPIDAARFVYAAVPRGLVLAIPGAAEPLAL